jgi:hypothetical protein
VASKFGRAYALITTAVSSLCAAVFLYELVPSIHVEDNPELAELALFCTGALLVSQFFGKRADYQLIDAQ